MFNLGDHVVVEGISQKGKNRCREHGVVWEISKVWGSQKLLVATDGTRYMRWVDGPDDPDFKIERKVIDGII